MTIANFPPPDLGLAATAVEAAHSGRMAPPPESGGLWEWLGWAADTSMRTFATDFIYYLLGSGLTFLLLWVLAV